MRKLLITSALLSFAAASFAQDFNNASRAEMSLELEYNTAEPYSGDGAFEEGSFALQYDTSAGRDSGLYYAIDLEANSYHDDETASLAAIHFGTQGNQMNFAGVAGRSFGPINASFAGFEGGYNGEQFALNARATRWWIDEVWHDNIRFDIRASYQFAAKWGVYYDYTHTAAVDGGFKADEFLGGFTYTPVSGHKLTMGIGNVHPQNTISGESKVWRQMGLSYTINFGGEGIVDPIDLTNFYSF